MTESAEAPAETSEAPVEASAEAAAPEASTTTTTEEVKTEEPSAEATTADQKNGDGDDSKRDRNRRNFSATERAQFKKNIKANFDNLPVSCDPVEIRKQAEFYFSDSNLPMDKFLLQQVGGKDNKPVPIKLINSFKRMRRFQPYEAVVAALQESTVLEVVDDDQIRRRVPLDITAESTRDEIRVFEDAAMPRTVYAKGFGKETESTQLDIEKLFEPFGPINSVRLRRAHPNKVFKGSVFVEFATEEKAQAFLDAETKPQWEGEDLLIMGKKAYCDMKVQEIKDGKISASSRSGGHGTRGKFQSGGRGRGGGNGRGRGGSRPRRGGPGGGRDFDNKRKRADDDSREQNKKVHTGNQENIPQVGASA